MNRKYIILFLGLLLACAQAGEESFFVDDTDFYPLNVVRIYEVSDIRYEITGVDTVSYFERESIGDTLIVGGDTTFVLVKERAATLSDAWTIDSLWNVRRDFRQLVIREDGRDKVKLVFPVVENRSWDRNEYNTLSSKIIEYRQAEIEDIQIDESLMTERSIKVVISDIPPNITGQNEHYELYGKGVGLLQKNLVVLNLCTGEDGCDIGDTLSGRFIEKKLISYE
jgi:hypothetical protein